jgi:phosphoglycerate dehydrogenase-like enzyme
MNTGHLPSQTPKTEHLLSRANLKLLGSGAVLLRSDRVPLLVIQLVDQLSDAEELVHLLKSHTLLVRVLASNLA